MAPPTKARNAVIDADTHVIECEHTWDFLDGSDKQYRPQAVSDGPNGAKFWDFSGRRFGRAGGDETLPLAVRDMSDLETRMRMMDEERVDMHVLYPTLFLNGTLDDRPAAQVALVKAYNHWLADACSRRPDRFRWVIAPPLADMNETLAEIEWGAAHGGCGVMMRGFDHNHIISDPYLYPMYQR